MEEKKSLKNKGKCKKKILKTKTPKKNIKRQSNNEQRKNDKTNIPIGLRTKAKNS